MNKLLRFVVLIIFLPNFSYSDPIPYTDDWSLLDETIKTELQFKNSNFDLVLKANNNELLLISNNKSKNIYQFNGDKFEVYIISQNNEPSIYLFNKTLKNLFVGNVKNNNVEFVSKPWNFGVLEAIIEDCEKIESSLMFKHDKNYMLTKFKYSKRPKEFKCYILMYGGRCELVFNPSSDEYNYNDKMIITDAFKYEGDVDEISYLIDSDYGVCKFYNKLSI